MTTLEMLREARGRISDEKDWWDGTREGPNCANGVRHCAVTALRGDWDTTLNAYEALLGTQVVTRISDFNDSHTHAEVLQLFDHAIARLEEQEEGCPISDTSTSSRLSLVPA